jgi:hypothetical protein
MKNDKNSYPPLDYNDAKSTLFALMRWFASPEIRETSHFDRDMNIMAHDFAQIVSDCADIKWDYAPSIKTFSKPKSETVA